jgi:hypothetical protein
MHRTLIRSAAVAFALAAAGPFVPHARGSDDTLATFDSCWKQVRKLPRAAARDDIPWSDLKREYRPRADAAGSGAELIES